MQRVLAPELDCTVLSISRRVKNAFNYQQRFVLKSVWQEKIAKFHMIFEGKNFYQPFRLNCQCFFPPKFNRYSTGRRVSTLSQDLSILITSLLRWNKLNLQYDGVGVFLIAKTLSIKEFNIPSYSCAGSWTLRLSTFQLQPSNSHHFDLSIMPRRESDSADY